MTFLGDMMKNNLMIKLICSLPVILIVMYFVPFLGVCLILFRYFVYNKKHYSTAMTLIVCGLLILLPKLVNYITSIFKITTKTPYLDEILESSVYTKILGFSKLLIIVGVVFLIISYIVNMVATKVGNGIKNYFQEEQKRDYEISTKNDLIIKEKQEKAKNTHFVKCPNCGASNTVIGNVGKCKFCRKDIEYKE